MRLDLVPVAAAVPFLDDIASLGQVDHDAVRRTFRDLEGNGELPQARIRIVSDEEQSAGVVC